MKTARIALLLVMMLILVACTERQRRTAMSAAANALLASLLDVQSTAPLTQSTFRTPRVIQAPVADPDAADREPVAAESISPIRCPLTEPLPLTATKLGDIAAHAAGVLEHVPGRDAAVIAQALARTTAKAQVISRCRYIRVREEKSHGRIVIRAEVTIPGDAIELSGADDRAL